MRIEYTTDHQGLQTPGPFVLDVFDRLISVGGYIESKLTLVVLNSAHVPHY